MSNHINTSGNGFGASENPGPPNRALRDLVGEAVWQELLQHAHTRRHRGGAMLLRQGDPGTHALALLTGVAKVVRTARDGGTTLLAFRGPGELLGEMAVLFSNTRQASVYTLSDCTVAVLSNPTLERFVAQHNLSPALVQHAFARLQESDRARSGGDLLARLADTLVRLADMTGRPPSSGPLELVITRDDLAQHLGASRNTVTALLVELERYQVEARRMRISLQNLPALRSLAAQREP